MSNATFPVMPPLDPDGRSAEDRYVATGVCCHQGLSGFARAQRLQPVLAERP